MRISVFVLVIAALSPLQGQKLSQSARVWLDEQKQPATANVNGVWYAGPEWGRIYLTQKDGERAVAGKGAGCEITGVVSGDTAYLLFYCKGKLNYSARLKSEEPARLAGGYVYGLLGANQGILGYNEKTRPLSLSRVAAGQQAAGPDLNLDGMWVSTDWGRVKLVQPAGLKSFTGKTSEYDIDGTVGENNVVLHFKNKGGGLAYTAELTPEGADSLSGRYAKGELRDTSSTKPITLGRAGSGVVDEGTYMNAVYWLKSHSEPPAVGLVSGRNLYLLFTSVGELGYSAALTLEDDKTLKGGYVSGIMEAGSKTRPMLLTKSGPVRLMPANYKASSTQTIDVTEFEFPDAVDFSDDYQAALSEELIRHPVNLKRFAQVTQAGHSDPAAKPADLRVTGVISALEQGNRATRMLVGMGAGRAFIRAHVKFVEAATGKVKLEQDAEGDMYGGVAGDTPIYAVTPLAKEIAKLAKGKGAL